MSELRITYKHYPPMTLREAAKRYVLENGESAFYWNEHGLVDLDPESEQGQRFTSEIDKQWHRVKAFLKV